MAKHLEPGYCCKCSRETAWEVHKNHQICTECRCRFPCASTDCSHVDCQEVRGQAWTCGGCSTIVRPDDGGVCPGCGQARIPGLRACMEAEAA